MRCDTILVPTDFSETADHAEAQAASIARRHRSRLELFHVIEPFWPPPPRMMTALQDYIDELEQTAEERLASRADAIRASGVDVTYSKTHHIPPFDAISDKIANAQPDLVVVGTHGRRGFKHLVLGSVAERLLRSVKVNVLTLNVNAPPVSGDLGVARILVPVDFSDSSSHALEAAFSLLADDGVIQLLHVVHAPAHPSFYPNPLADGQDAVLSSHARTHLDNWIGERRAEPTIRVGDPAHEILHAQEETGAELIVMGTSGITGLNHLVLGSVADKVVRQSAVPVLTVH